MIKHQLTVANALIVIKHPEKKRGTFTTIYKCTRVFAHRAQNCLLYSKILREGSPRNRSYTDSDLPLEPLSLPAEASLAAAFSISSLRCLQIE
jgi:hypothetical protein